MPHASTRLTLRDDPSNWLIQPARADGYRPDVVFAAPEEWVGRGAAGALEAMKDDEYNLNIGKIITCSLAPAPAIPAPVYGAKYGNGRPEGGHCTVGSLNQPG